MLTVKSAAERVGVSGAMIYGLCASGRLGHHRVGGKGRRGSIRILEADLDAFLASCRRGEQGGEVKKETKATRPELRHLKL